MGHSWWCHQMETFSALLAICMGNSPLNSLHKGQWRGALMFSLTCAWMNSSVNNRKASYLRCHCAHYDVTVMCVWANEIDKKALCDSIISWYVLISGTWNAVSIRLYSFNSAYLVINTPIPTPKGIKPAQNIKQTCWSPGPKCCQVIKNNDIDTAK